MFCINGQRISVERFPDGTPRLSVTVADKQAEIEWLYEKDEDILLFFLTKHLRANGADTVSLRMPYIPNARMDRVERPGEVFTLRFFCEFINSLEFDRVTVRDPHSDVSLKLLKNAVSEDISPTLRDLIQGLLDPQKDIVFFPDEGGRKRYGGMFGFPYASGIKKRDWATGNILGLEVSGNVPAEPFNALIIDDISSFGGTFLNAAKKLKELGADKIYLYVTHCENSVLKGELINSGLLERIYTTESIFTERHPLIEIIGGKDNE